MSLILQLDVPDLDWDTAEGLMDLTRQEGVLPLVGPRRRRWFTGKPNLAIADSLEDGSPVFDGAAVDAGHEAAIAPAARERLARTLLLVAESVEPGWYFHAGWGGDWEREADIGADALADLARGSQLDAAVRYCVR